ncbi:ferrochelatase [Verticiella sediminum]|uniref:Ferrochelatase n=1 Tax=Verticiella sediminum TaxID=1247510 RepID=A0A556AYM0_9BURK|nr:ferrochelatase [Verticiella sediminum]TSH98031.1 ferrochelatase [Verticiella sediminum]
MRSRFLPEPEVPAHAPLRGVPGIVLVNLGTPSAPEPAAIRRFLREFLSDPRVVELPRWLWWPILNGPVAWLRPRRIQHNYASVWLPGGSPLLVHSLAQRDALQARLRERGVAAEVVLAMRYGEPALAGAIDGLRARGCGRILVLPLYPQYSASTTATVVDAVAAHLARLRNQPETRFVLRYSEDAGYIAALAESVRAHWRSQGRGGHLLMSYHGLPKASVALGDPYHAECEATSRHLARALGLADDAWTMTFQSRFGAAEWLQPYTEPTARALAGQGVRTLDVVCPGFAADCLETLEEVAQGCARTFRDAGGQALRYIPALNAEPAWIDALATLAERNLLGWAPGSSHDVRTSHDPTPEEDRREQD